MSENSVIGHFQKSRFSVAISIRESPFFRHFLLNLAKFGTFFEETGTVLEKGFFRSQMMRLSLNDASFRSF